MQNVFFFTGIVSSEELIKYAHRISSSNAVEAPVSWMPGQLFKISKLPFVISYYTPREDLEQQNL